MIAWNSNIEITWCTQVLLTNVSQVCSPARADVLLQLEGKDHKLESVCKIEHLRRRAWESAEPYN